MLFGMLAAMASPFLAQQLIRFVCRFLPGKIDEWIDGRMQGLGDLPETSVQSLLTRPNGQEMLAPSPNERYMKN